MWIEFLDVLFFFYLIFKIFVSICIELYLSDLQNYICWPPHSDNCCSRSPSLENNVIWKYWIYWHLLDLFPSCLHYVKYISLGNIFVKRVKCSSFHHIISFKYVHDAEAEDTCYQERCQSWVEWRFNSFCARPRCPSQDSKFFLTFLAKYKSKDLRTSSGDLNRWKIFLIIFLIFCVFINVEKSIC